MLLFRLPLLPHRLLLLLLTLTALFWAGNAVLGRAIAGRTVHAYHVEGSGGGHVPDAIGLWLKYVLQSPAMFLLGLNLALLSALEFAIRHESTASARIPTRGPPVPV